MAMQVIRNGYAERREEELSRLLDNYGVTEVLTPEQYENLVLIGYDSNSKNMGTTGAVLSQANDASHEYTMTGIGMRDLDKHDVTKDFQINIKKAKKANNDKEKVHTYDPYTNTEGKGVSLDEDVQIYNIQYYAKNPNKVIITTTDGNIYAVDPHLISATVAEMVADAAERLKNKNLSSYDRQIIQLSTARNIYLAINAYNPEAGKTLSPSKW
jgi:hypothetical protein